jgi:hypothetical protein
VFVRVGHHGGDDAAVDLLLLVRYVAVEDLDLEPFGSCPLPHGVVGRWSGADEDRAPDVRAEWAGQGVQPAEVVRPGCNDLALGRVMRISRQPLPDGLNPLALDLGIGVVYVGKDEALVGWSGNGLGFRGGVAGATPRKDGRQLSWIRYGFLASHSTLPLSRDQSARLGYRVFRDY